MTSHEVEKFIIENYPTMDLSQLSLLTGVSIPSVRAIAYVNNVYRKRNTTSIHRHIPKIGTTKALNGCSYIWNGTKWVSYVRFVYEQHEQIPMGYKVVIKDKSKTVEIDNLVLVKKSTNGNARPEDVELAKRICNILDVDYDDLVLGGRGFVLPKVRRIYSRIHSDINFDIPLSKRYTFAGVAINRDRTQVIHYLKKFDTDIKFDSKLRKMYEKVKENL